MIHLVTVTRLGARRTLRVNPATVAYVDEDGDGHAILAFGSGESVRVEESAAEVERRVAAVAAVQAGELASALLRAAAPQEIAPAAPARRPRA